MKHPRKNHSTNNFGTDPTKNGLLTLVEAVASLLGWFTKGILWPIKIILFIFGMIFLLKNLHHLF